MKEGRGLRARPRHEHLQAVPAAGWERRAGAPRMRLRSPPGARTRPARHGGRGSSATDPRSRPAFLLRVGAHIRLSNGGFVVLRAGHDPLCHTRVIPYRCVGRRVAVGRVLRGAHRTARRDPSRSRGRGVRPATGWEVQTSHRRPRLVALGPTRSGRLLFVVCEMPTPAGTSVCVTARPVRAREQRLYEERT